MSRTPNDQSKIQGNSLPEVVRAWKQCTLDLADDPDIREAARGALRDGNLLNAFLIYCLSLDPEQRKDAAARGLRTLERLKERDNPLDLRKLAPHDLRSLGGIPDEKLAEPGGPKGARVRGAQRERQSKRTG